MAEQNLRNMTGAELKSMLKSNVNFKSLGGMKCEELTLRPEDKMWWRNQKIGIFFHWGLYSILGRGEWVRFNEKIPKEQYESLADEFIPQEFDMKEWADLAQDFGARYGVMVTKHHDGFSLWNSEGSYEHFTSFHRGAHRDFVKEYVDAFRKAGLNVGVYYSPMDWRFPGYFDPKGLPDNAALMKKQCYQQVEELCSSYHPDILWYDGGWLAHEGSDTSSAWFWEPVKLNKIARKYNPRLLINPRSGWEGDFYCDEGPREVIGNIIPVPWEKNMCICSGRSWGWIPDDAPADFKWLIQMMVDVVCRGGNWLVNIGPDRNGKIPEEVKHRAHEIGEWLRTYGETIYNTNPGPYQPVDHVYGCTYSDDRAYLHILDTEAFRGRKLPMIDNEIVQANLFHGQELEFRTVDGGIIIDCPVSKEEPDTIVVLKMKAPIKGIEDMKVYFTGKE